jgi:hypothetical protein
LAEPGTPVCETIKHCEQVRQSGCSSQRFGWRKSEGLDLDDLATFIGYDHRPATVTMHLMQQSTPEFRCGLVSGSLGCQRIRQINPFTSHMKLSSERRWKK